MRICIIDILQLHLRFDMIKSRFGSVGEKMREGVLKVFSKSGPFSLLPLDEWIKSCSSFTRGTFYTGCACLESTMTFPFLPVEIGNLATGITPCVPNEWTIVNAIPSA